jgi:hypothetical protein
MPFDGLTSPPKDPASFRAPGIVTAWLRLAASEAEDRLGESHRGDFLSRGVGRVEPGARRPGRKNRSTGNESFGVDDLNRPDALARG